MSEVEHKTGGSRDNRRRAIALGLGWIVFLTILGYMVASAPMGLVDLTKSEVPFSAAKIRTVFAGLEDLNRLARYQYADFFFIAAYTFVLFFTARSMSRLFDYSRRFWNYVAFLFPAAALFDVTENILMLRMISEPQTFPDSTAIVYSSVAALKLALFFGGILVGLVAFVLLKAKKIMRSREMATQ